MGEVREVPLKKPITGHEGPISKVVLREPTYDEYLVHGDPYTVASSKGQNAFIVESADVIAAYMTICVVEPKDPALLKQCVARDGRDIKEALLSFFRPDAEGGAGSANSRTNSLSTASGTSASSSSSG